MANTPFVFIKNYGLSEYKASSQNWDLLVSPDGILYVANNSGLLTFDGNNWILYELPDKSSVLRVTLLRDTVFTRSETSIGYWTPSSTGELTYQELTHDRPDVSFRNRTTSLSAGKYEFTSTLAEGVHIADSAGNILVHLTTENGLQDNIVNNMYMENQRKVWFALDNGVCVIIMDPALSLLAKRSKVGKLSDAVLLNHTIYIRTNINYYKSEMYGDKSFVPIRAEEVVWIFNQKTEKETITPEYLLKETPYIGELNGKEKIYPVSDRLYWLTNDNEARLIHLKGKDIQLRCRILFDNYHMNLINRGRQIIPLNDSLHIASTVQGVLLINTMRLVNNTRENGLRFRFTRIEYTDGKGIHLHDPDLTKLFLPYNFHEATVYVGSSVFNPNNQISYRIDNISSRWSEWQRNGKITFLQLPEGDYKLRIRKYIPSGNFPEILLNIRICPPWYKTRWAYYVYFILFVMLVLTAIIAFKKKLKRKEQLRLDAEQQKVQQLKGEMLEKELKNKKNELMIQTSALTQRGIAMQTLSKELDRQKKMLGDHYPDRFYAKMHSLLNETLNNQSEWIAFDTYFDSAHQDFIDRFRQRYPGVNHNDIRMCCLIRMNLSTKEIASILNISIRAVELRRYRLRKRMGLETDKNLSDFLMKF